MNSILYSYREPILIFAVLALMCLAFAAGYFHRWRKELAKLSANCYSADTTRRENEHAA